VPWGRGQTREAQHERRRRAQHRMDLEVQHKTRETWSLQGAQRSGIRASRTLGAGTNARSAARAPPASSAQNGPGSTIQNTQNMEFARSTGELNLLVSYLGGGGKRAKRSTSAAGGLRTEWAWRCITKHAKHGECKEHRGAESARLVPWGRGQMREAQQRRLSRRKEEKSRAEERKEE
jgi:hypothetical protein